MSGHFSQEGRGVPEIRYYPICNSIPGRIGEPPPCGYSPPCSGGQLWTEDELTRIRRVLRRLTSQRVCNPEDAEDLVQETLLTMVRKAPATDIEKGILIWSMGILRKKVGNYYRKTQRCASLEGKRNIPLDAIPGLAGMFNPESSLHHAELCDRIEEILGSLSTRERQAVDLFLSGFETHEIVALLHPERYQNVVNRLHRGRRKIAKGLAKYGYSLSRIGRKR